VAKKTFCYISDSAVSWWRKAAFQLCKGSHTWESRKARSTSGVSSDFYSRVQKLAKKNNTEGWTELAEEGVKGLAAIKKVYLTSEANHGGHKFKDYQRMIAWVTSFRGQEKMSQKILEKKMVGGTSNKHDKVKKKSGGGIVRGEGP